MYLNNNLCYLHNSSRGVFNLVAHQKQHLEPPPPPQETHLMILFHHIQQTNMTIILLVNTHLWPDPRDRYRQHFKLAGTWCQFT